MGERTFRLLMATKEQLQFFCQIDKLDKEFYEKADILLGFTDNAYEYFSKGNIKQKRKILEIISDEITYKDKNFNVKLFLNLVI